MIIGDAHDQPRLPFIRSCMLRVRFLSASCPGLCRASTSSDLAWIKTWMAGSADSIVVCARQTTMPGHDGELTVLVSNLTHPSA